MKLGLVLLLLLALAGSAWAQRRHRGYEPLDEPSRPAQPKKQKGPRALGVIEFAPNGKARLIPITILVREQWYDAGIYMASPRPMALGADTVYEGEKSGQPQGLFTVTAVQQLGRNFLGLGSWKPMSGEPEVKKTRTEAPAKSEIDMGDDRPILHRAKPESGSEEKTETTPATVTVPQTSTPAPAPPASTPPATEQKTAAAKPAPEHAEEGPERPVLRRGKPGVEQADSINMPSSAGDFAVKPASGKAVAAKPGAVFAPSTFRTLAAISDAGVPQPQSYVYVLNPTERENYNRRVAQLASQALQKFMATRASKRPVPNVTSDNSQVQIFDLSNNNEPVFVLTAKVSASSAAPVTTVRKVDARNAQPAMPSTSDVEYYVTLVVREDVTGDLRTLFTSVTDSTRLDAYPKLDLIDAVGANGDGTGELLFRETFDRSREFVLYRVGMDQLWKLFEGAQSRF